MKKHLCGLLFVSLITLAFPVDNIRQGFVFGVGLRPDFSYSLISTSMENSQAWYSHYLGGCSAELRFGYSRNGKNVSSFVSGFTWNYPSSLFLFSLFEGYGFTHYMMESAPCFSYGFDAGITFSNTAGIDISYPAIGIKSGFKAGYEFMNHYTVWVGYNLGSEIRNYSINKMGIDANDLSGTIKNYGPQNATDFILNNSISLSVSYSVY